MSHRYHSLQQPMQIRRDNLEDALLLHQFLRDVEDELQWVAEKQPQAASTDLGTSLTAVQSLQKKHQASKEHKIQTRLSFMRHSVCIILVSERRCLIG